MNFVKTKKAMKKDNKSDSALLRQKAEELLKKKSSGTASPLSEVESLRLIHELEVHQVELEMQNEELQRARAIAEVANDKYIRLYDFAPSGYFTLSVKGEIIELNISGARMLGKDRQHLKSSLFGFFVSEETKPIFSLFLEKAFKSKSKESCEVGVLTVGGSSIYIHLVGETSENGEQCQIAAVDVTLRFQAQDALKEAEWKFQALFEKGPIGVAYHKMIYDNSGKPVDYYFIDANERYQELTGVDPRGKTVKQAFPGIENDSFNWIETFGHVARTGEQIRFEQYLQPNSRWYDCVGYQYKPDHFVAAFIEITERKLIEKKLFSQTMLLEAQLNSTIDGILIVSQKQKQILTNRRMIDMFSVPGDIAEDEDDSKLLKHVTDLAKNPKKFLEKVLSLYDHPMEESRDEIEFANGMVVDRYSAPVIGWDGQDFGRIWIFRDITERKQAEEKVREKDIQFEKLSSQVPDLIYQFTRRPDGSYCVPIASTGIMNIFGCSPEDVRDDFGPIARVIFPEDSDRVISDIEYSAHHLSDFNCEFRVQIPGRELQWILSRAVPEKLMDGSITWYGFTANITAIKSTEEKLRESNELRKSLLQTIPFGMDIVDESGNILFLSDTLKLQFGAEALGEKCWDLYRDDKKQCSDCPLISGIKIGETKVYESSGVQGGKTFEIYHTGMIYNGQKAMLEAFIDITRRKLIEHELIIGKEKAEESDNLKSAFLANMSHEIRTPMNGILGFAGLLKEPGLNGEEQQKYIRIIEKSGARMLNIINDIVDISKIEAGQMEVALSSVNVNEVTDSFYSFFKPEAEKKGIQLILKNSLPAKESVINTDRGKFDSILSNLIKNAIKYTHTGSIEFGYTLPHESFLQFFIRDTGIGIPKERQEAIFERFIQADISDKQAYQGAGLGLAIAKAYVEMLGGKIWVQSDEGIGSIFYFTIPYITEEQVRTNIPNIIPAEEESVQIKNLKILIAEDDETSDFLITRILGKNNNEFSHATTGVETVDACRNNPDLDLVLMDINMPEMDGYEATRQIRQFNTDVIIIAQTAYGLAGDRERAIESGLNDYISKPINKEELLALIQKYFNK